MRKLISSHLVSDEEKPGVDIIMGQVSSRALLKYNSILNLFTAIVVLVVFLLVSYSLIFGPCCSEYLYPGKGRPRETKLIRAKVNENPGVDVVSMKTANICETGWMALLNDFRSLIPDFRRAGSRKLLLGKHAFKNSITTRARLQVARGPCKDNICSEYLSASDKSRFCFCLDRMSSWKLTPEGSKCKFIKGDDRDPVALISFPGSGNTWVRGILESITGICTGAIYCDISLRSRGFTGEFLREGSVLVVKTHETRPLWMDDWDYHRLQPAQGRYGSAIFIVRNPLNALIAEWNRKVANNFTTKTINLDSHTEIAEKEWFGENERWHEFVLKQVNRWRAMIRNWVIKRQDHPVLVVKYESLKFELVAQSKRMLDFLGINYSKLQLENLLNHVQTFHRNHSNDFDHYTPYQRSYVHSVVKETISLLHTNHLSDAVDFNDYLL